MSRPDSPAGRASPRALDIVAPSGLRPARPPGPPGTPDSVPSWSEALRPPCGGLAGEERGGRGKAPGVTRQRPSGARTPTLAGEA